MVVKFRFAPVIAALALLSACGGGGDLETDASNTGAASTGLVVDGYLSIAKVVCDTNGNGVADSGETVTYTNTLGEYVFRTGCAFGILASGGTNIDTNSAFLGQLRAPAGATVTTPLTTLIAAGMSQAQVISALSLPADTQLLTTDPAAKNGDALKNFSLYKKTLAVQQILQKTSNLFTTLGKSTDSDTAAALYAQAANAFAAVLKKEVSPLIDSNGRVSSSIVKGMVTAAIEQVLVAPAVPQAIQTAIIESGGVSTLPALVDDAFTSQAQSFIDASHDEALAAVTLRLQKSTVVEVNVATALTAGALSATATAEQVQALKVNIALTLQVPLMLNVEPSSLFTSGQAKLSTSGGSGTGALIYKVTAGACTLNGDTLTAPASPDTCTVIGTKASDSVYAATSTPSIDVPVTVTFTSTSKMDFEPAGKGAMFAWSTFENDTNPAAQIVANPSKTGINTSDKVIKFTALKNGKDSAGFQSAHGTDLGTVTFSASNALVKMMVYKNVISPVGVKFANVADISTGDVKVENTKINEWEQLTFNFCDRVGEVNDRIIFFPDFAARAADTTSYLDNITFNACPPPAPPEPDTAPAVPTALTENVLSLYGDGYKTVTGTDTPKWGNSTDVSAKTYVANNVLKFSNFDYQGIITKQPLNIAGHTHVHLDLWSQTTTTIGVKLVSREGGTKETMLYIPLIAGQWLSTNIALSRFTAPDKTKFEQLILEAAKKGGTLYVDNVYFWK